MKDSITMPFPHIDPVAFTLFGWPVHWYGLAYVCAFTLGVMYLKYIITKRPAKNLTPEKAEDFFTWVILGVILGGRLGYVFFYDPAYYLAHPSQIVMIWQGGMSFHGGLIGVILSSYLFCRKHKIAFFDLTDRLAPTGCIGLLLGRIANFINGELYGNVTSQPWGIIFPRGGELPRHPSQLYEAALEGILLFVCLHMIFLWRKNLKTKELSGFFLIGYGCARFTVEFFRARDAHLTNGIFEVISMGQILCIPMILCGIILLYFAQKGKQA